MIVAIPLGMGAAALAGLVNGVGVAYGGLPPFIMTLGMLSFARGLAFIYTGGTPVPINNESFYAFGNGYFAGVPIPSLILIAALVVSGFVLQLTPFGRSVYAIGSNEEAARLSGVPVKVYTTIVYVISGLSVGACGPRLRVAAQHRHADRRAGLRTGRHRGGRRRRHVAVRRQGLGGRARSSAR